MKPDLLERRIWLMILICLWQISSQNQTGSTSIEWVFRNMNKSINQNEPIADTYWQLIDTFIRQLQVE